MHLRDLMVLEQKRSVTFRGARMSRAQRRDIAQGRYYMDPMPAGRRERGISGQTLAMSSDDPATRPTGRNKPSLAKLRKAGVVVPRKANARKANALAKRRAKLIAAKNKPAKPARARKNAYPRTLESMREDAIFKSRRFTSSA